MVKKINLGIIGCGAHGLETLIPVITKTQGLDIVAISEPSAANAKRAMQLAGTKSYYPNYNEMLLKEDLDAVVVAVPSDLLSRVTVDSAKAGLHVFVEKPMATKVDQAHQMIEAARKANVRLMVGFCQRYARVRKEMKQLLEKGGLGELKVVTAGKGNLVPHGWRMNPGKGGGILLWLGCHIIDQILWLVGSQVRRVFGEINRTQLLDEPFYESTKKRRYFPLIDDTALFSMRFQNRVIAGVICSMQTPVLFDFIELRGSEGYIRSDWSPRDLNRIEVFSRNIQEYETPKLIEVEEEKELGWRTMYQRELEEFRDAILEERDPEITGEDGERVLRVVEAIFESALSGRPVSLAETTLVP